MFVYVIVNSETLKIYVGQHKGENLGKYLSKKFYVAHWTPGTRSYIYAAMRKYPRDQWSIHPLVSGVETRQELDALERHYIKVLKSQHPDVGYNICDGGEGFTGTHSDEWKKARSLKMLGHFVSAETRAKLSVSARAQKGKKLVLSAQRRDQLIKQMTGNTYSAGRTPTNKGKPLSLAIKKKVSEGVKRALAARGNWWVGRKHSDETRRKISLSMRRPKTRLLKP